MKRALFLGGLSLLLTPLQLLAKEDKRPNIVFLIVDDMGYSDMSYFGYRTLMAGKWHLGREGKALPNGAGFTRSVSMLESGSSVWRKHSYVPNYTAT
jgi:arylsulfatase A-like enzyme